MGPLLPDCADLAAGFYLCDEVGGGAAVAHDFGVCDAHGGVIVGPLALDGFGGGGGGEAFVTGGVGVLVLLGMKGSAEEEGGSDGGVVTLGMSRRR